MGRERAQVAADTLKRAKGELQELIKVMDVALKTDVEDIKNKTQREFNDLAKADNLAGRVKKDL